MVSRYEKLARKELKEDGWIIDYKLRGRFPTKGYSVDFFGAFDIMAYKSGILKFISVKGDMGILKTHRELLESFKFPKGVQKEIWQYDPKRKEKWRKELLE